MIGRSEPCGPINSAFPDYLSNADFEALYTECRTRSEAIHEQHPLTTNLNWYRTQSPL